MTARRGLHVQIDGSLNGVAPGDARLSQAAIVADDGASQLSARNGVFYDGQGNVVATNTDTGTMSYTVRACQFALYLLGTAASGIVFPTNDASFKATTTAAPGSNSRIDIIYIRQHCLAADGGTDTDNIAEIKVAQGAASGSPIAPTLPTGAMELARATVPAGTTSTSTLTLSQTHLWTTTHGSAIPVRNATERNALTPSEGMRVRRLDLHSDETHNGTTWAAPTSIRYDSTAATITVGTSLVPVTNWLTNAYNLGDISYAAGVFTINTPGIYRWEATVVWPAAAATYRVTQGIMVNGSIVTPGEGTMNFASGFGVQVITSGFTLQLNATDTLQLGLIASTAGVAGTQPSAIAVTRVA